VGKDALTKTRARVITTDAEIDAAIARAKLYEPYRPKAVAAEYRARTDTLVMRLATGVEIIIPRRLLQGLEGVDPAAVARVKVENFGSSLHWPGLDVDHYVPGLLEGVFGTRKWMAEIGRRGGKARSKSKTRSSRANGRKGGRPRKRVEGAA
jgi:hypothetical protein